MPTDGEIQFINLQIADAQFLPTNHALRRLFHSPCLAACPSRRCFNRLIQNFPIFFARANL